MSQRLAAIVATLVAGTAAACGAETTSFRPTDRSDPHHAGPPSAAYDVYLAGQLVARAHVWSNGGYVSSSDEPMTHLGFEINSATMRPLTFDADALELALYDGDGATLPAARFTAITPLGPSLVIVPPASSAVLGAYFLLPVRPRTVEAMQLRWTLRTETDEYREITGFVREDSAKTTE